MKTIASTYEKQCPYCRSTNVHYLGYNRKDEQVLIDFKDPDKKPYAFKCEDCKRIFYYCGKL